MNRRTLPDVFVRCLPKTKKPKEDSLEYSRPGATSVRSIPYLYT